jgi:hypothetical protein
LVWEPRFYRFITLSRFYRFCLHLCRLQLGYGLMLTLSFTLNICFVSKLFSLVFLTTTVTNDFN